MRQAIECWRDGNELIRAVRPNFGNYDGSAYLGPGDKRALLRSWAPLLHELDTDNQQLGGYCILELDAFVVAFARAVILAMQGPVQPTYYIVNN